MNQFLRPVGFFGLCGLLFLPSSGQSNDDMRSMQNPKVSQHMAFIDVNRAKLGTLKDTDFGSSCSASYRRSAFRAGYAQATQMTSTVEIASDDLNTPEMHPLLSAILGPDKDPAFLQDTYKAVEEQFASNNPLNNAMLCYTAASVSFNVTTGKPLRSHSDLREEIKCCIEGYKKGQRETLLALDQKPAPSELCVELFNAGVDSVKNKCKNLDCHQDISDPATRLRLILTTAYNVIPNDFTELLLSRFGYCFPENTSREKKLKYEQMRAQLRSCYSWGRGKAMEECANLTFQQQEAQSTSASPASDQPGIKGPTPTVVAPQGKPTSNGAAAK